MLLGALQGATEFLPVSSSGHLVLAEHLLGLRPSLAVNAALHAGTLAAVVFYYRQDLAAMIRQALVSLLGLFRGRGAGRIWREDHATRLGLLIALGSVPTAVIGLALKGPVEQAMDQAAYTCGALLVTGALLWATRYAPRSAATAPAGAGVGAGEPGPGSAPPPAHGGDRAPAGVGAGEPARATDVTPWIALVVGVAQGMAVFPGISRSGATIAAALLLGVARADAARFAFLLSIPAILGALVLEGGALFDAGRAGAVPLALGVVTAVVAGYASLVLLVALVRRGGLHYFAFYVIPLGLVGLVYFRLA
jgi:undecaprenyl-diphosphatase